MFFNAFQIALLVLFPSLTMAIESDKALAGNSFFGLGSQVLIVLLLVIALLFIITWLLRRSGLAQQAANRHLKILGGVSIGPKERVLLLQVGQDQILVGVTASEINLLHMLSEPVSVDDDSSCSVSFTQQLQSFIHRRNSEQKL